MDKIVEKAFELGLPGFLLLVVLMLMSTLVVKMFGAINSNNNSIKVGMSEITAAIRSDLGGMSEKLQLLTERVIDTNASLNTQLINSNSEMSNLIAQSSIRQDNILSVMKETIVSVNNNTLRMAILENKTEGIYTKIQEVSVKADTTADKLDDINLKLETMIHELK